MNIFIKNEFLKLKNNKPINFNMKRLFISLILIASLTITSQSVFAGDDSSFGVRGGYQSSGFFDGGSHLAGTSNYKSFYLGIYREKKILLFFRYSTGLEYSQDGAKLLGDNYHRLNYLGLPIYLKAKVGPVFALAGFSPKFKIGEKIDINGVTTKPTGDDKSKFFDLPVFAGAGVNFLMLTIEARYYYSFMKVNNGAQNASFQLGAAVHF
jgi:hypothetical protein